MRKEAEDMHETAVIEVVNIMARVAAKRSRSQLRRRCPVAFLRKTSQFTPLLSQLRHSSEKPSARETAATPIEHPGSVHHHNPQYRNNEKFINNSQEEI
nr:hypothetical protein Iba_chr14bCG8920 [Ipomoea batatas]